MNPLAMLFALHALDRWARLVGGRGGKCLGGAGGETNRIPAETKNRTKEFVTTTTERNAMDMNATIALNARTIARAAYHLAEATRDALPEPDREQWDLLELGGADVALTVRFHADRLTMKLGFVSDDGAHRGVLELSLPRPTDD